MKREKKMVQLSIIKESMSMKFHHVAITVSDMERSIEFYKSVFGFQEIERLERKDLECIQVFLQLGFMRLELFCFQDLVSDVVSCHELKSIGIRHLAFEVDDLEFEIQHLRSLGLMIGDSKIGRVSRKYVFFNDPDGIVLELFESKKS